MGCNSLKSDGDDVVMGFDSILVAPMLKGIVGALLNPAPGSPPPRMKGATPMADDEAKASTAAMEVSWVEIGVMEVATEEDAMVVAADPTTTRCLATILKLITRFVHMLISLFSFTINRFRFQLNFCMVLDDNT
jgi:hypothetical protein